MNLIVCSVVCVLTGANQTNTHTNPRLHERAQQHTHHSHIHQSITLPQYQSQSHINDNDITGISSPGLKLYPHR